MVFVYNYNLIAKQLSGYKSLICIKEQCTTSSSYLSYYTEFLHHNRGVLSAELPGILYTYHYSATKK